MGESSNIQFSLFPIESSPSQVSDENFNLFHSIDRELFTRLIQSLGRDPAHSVQIMAFWMWLERESKDMHFIKKLLTLPLALLNDVVDETVVCLRCLDDDGFHGGDDSLVLLPEILSNRINNVVSLRLFHENRTAVAKAVGRIIDTVCKRAFGDILRRASAVETPPPPMAAGLYHSHLSVPYMPLPPPAAEGGGVLGMQAPMSYMPPAAAGAAGGGVLGMPAPMNYLPPAAAGEVLGVPVHMMGAAAGGFPAYDMAAQMQMLSNELGEMMSRNLSINNNNNNNNNRGEENVGNGGGEEIEVAADDRTIFLTFSKGYPISEDEVFDFFTRRFGDFIEDLIMQEVGEDEQVLYARMVARSEAVIDGIVGGNKAKYVINGKHVWARKYVKKQHQARWSPTRDDQPPSSSPPATVHGGEQS
ncbi:hypothetical protein CASFOL_006450 [Castilleja foliolosa]|uniref:Uncharacterized protein n=1 Tax=Castilleja foliolosa TaxID=1961234 RepID=A0ABD3E8G5_9LAMI